MMLRSILREDYRAGFTIDCDQLTVSDVTGGITSSHYRWDAIFTSHDGTVRKDAADLCDNTAGHGKKRGPYWIGEWRNQDVSFL